MNKFLLCCTIAFSIVLASLGRLSAQEKHCDSLKTLTRAGNVASGSEETPIPPSGIVSNNLITPSPDGCALIRSITTPVDKYTGVANIQIPITEIKAGENSIPVALSYQASGIKVQDVASSVGLGWRLIAGGRITRSIRGRADNLENFENRTEMLDTTTWTRAKFDERIENQFDSEPDLFYFEYPGGGGMFVFDENGIPRMIPDQNIQIEYADQQFTIRDANGTKYLFTTAETTFHKRRMYGNDDPKTQTFVSSWFLDQICYANGQSVAFCYHEDADYSYINKESQTLISYFMIPESSATIKKTVSIEHIIEIQKPKYLSSIRYKDYEVNFSYNSTRVDLQGARQLDTISVSYIGQKPRKFRLVYEIFDNKNLKLKQLNDISISSSPITVCKFEYYETNNLPSRNSAKAFATDHWGYYNGVQIGANRYPNTEIDPIGHPHYIINIENGISKEPSLQYTQANSLQKIVFGSGGSKQFEYDLHQGINIRTGIIENAGGLRIRRIREIENNSSSPSVEAVRSYTYENGTIYADKINYCIYSDRNVFNHETQCWISTSSVNDLTDLNGCSVIYSAVTEQLPNGGKIVYKYAPYSQYEDEDADLYTIENGLQIQEPEMNPRSPKTSRHWLRNLLLEEIHYANDSEVKRTSYEYCCLATRRKICGINYYKEDFTTPCGHSEARYNIAKYYLESQPIAVSKISARKGRFNLASTTEYQYNDSTLLPVQIVRTDSLGAKTIVSMKYPTDYATNNPADVVTDALAKMKSENVIASPVETVTRFNGRVVGANLNLYSVVNDRLVLSDIKRFYCDPDTVRTSFSDSYVDDSGHFTIAENYETVWKAERFDLDNTLLTTSDRGGRKSTVLYGYRNTLPVAIVQNASHLRVGSLFDTREEVLHYTEGTNYLTLQQPQVVDFDVTISDTGTIGRELEVLIVGRTLPASGIYMQNYFYPKNNKIHFSADLPEGSFYIYYRWTDAGLATDYPDAATSIRVNNYRPVISGQTGCLFHTSFETEVNPVTLPPTNKYIIFNKAKSGNRVCKLPYEIDLRKNIQGWGNDTVVLSYWKYRTRKADPRWEYVEQQVVSTQFSRTYTIDACDSIYIDEVRVMPRGALMTTCTYEPGVGKTSETDASGVTTHYRYDAAGRLIKVLGQDGQLLKRYTYVGNNRIEEESINGNAELLKTVTYLDGFGRPEQTIGVEASPNGEDIVQFYNYDCMGRADSVAYMPYAWWSNGSKRPDPAAEQRTFYNSMFGSTHLSPYTIKLYDNTPQGEVWTVCHPNDLEYTTNYLYRTNFDYNFNTDSDSVRYYSVINDSLLRWQRNYAAAELRVKKTFQRNSGGAEHDVTREFYDGENRLIMSERIVPAAQPERTYYVYDDFGRKRAVIPAPANALFTAVGDTPVFEKLHAYCYFSVYDRYGRVIKQSKPGAGWEEMLYDRRDRLVMSRKAGMKEDDKWIFTHYDDLDRPVVSGTYTGGTYETHQAAFDAGTPDYPAIQSESDVLTRYYYDNYSWHDNSTHIFYTYSFDRKENFGGQIVTRKEENKMRPFVPGLETGRKNKVLGIDEDKWVTTTTYYDNESRVAQTNTELYPYKGKWEQVINHRNAVGNITSVYVGQKTAAFGYLISGYLKQMTYDSRDRLKSIQMLTFLEGKSPKISPPQDYMVGWDQVNDKVVVAEYTYDELGRVKTKSIHNGLETSTYNYDLTHMTGISSPSFSYTFGFEHPTSSQATSRFDGLLSEVTWQRGTENPKGYVFSYDDLGQMTGGRHIEKNGTAWTANSGYGETAVYGASGTITKLTRTDAEGTETEIAQSYDGYRMTGVSVDGTAAQEFRYDADGNMIYDGNQNVEIQYNILGLPEKIVGGSNEIRYIYNSDGQKLASAIDGSFTYYRNTILYENESGIPTKIYHPEGFITLDPTTGDFQYKYYKCDHLGSVRALLAVVDEEDWTQTLVEEQRTDFYPFGMQHGNFENLHLNRTLFSGKELQDAAIGNGGMLGWYDFGARYYNPYIGHWMTPDPALQVFNPYLFCGNAPMCYIDQDGRFFWIIVGVAAAFGAYMGGAAANDSWAPWKWDWSSGKTWGGFLGGAIQGAISGAAIAYGASVFTGKTLLGTSRALTTMGKFVRGTSFAFSSVKALSTVPSMINNFGNAMDIMRGNYLYGGDSFGENLLRGFSRGSWERLQQYMGNTFAHMRNGFDRVDVDYFYGATVINKNEDENTRSWGVTMGNMINGYNVHRNGKLYHEYGHSIQSRRWGPLFLPVVGIASADAAGENNSAWCETQANRLAYNYFGQEIWNKTAGAATDGGNPKYPLY